MLDPREISPGSNMPPYAHLAKGWVRFSESADKLRAMRTVGVPYRPEQIQGAAEDALKDALVIARDLETSAGAQLPPQAELIALIAYLQRLGVAPQPKEVQ